MSEFSEWNWLPLEELIQDGRPICYGVLKPGDEEPEGVPLIRIVDIGDGEIHTENLFRINRFLDHEFKRSRVTPGDLLLSIQGTIGRVAVVPSDLQGANISRTIARISFADYLSPSFYKHWIKSNEGLKATEDATVGSTRSSLNLSVLKRVLVPLPPREEMFQVADVLEVVDTQIQKTEALIAKLEKVKEGLLHDLLTRGIDENGQLRPRPEQAPELYKDSPLGLIPREWSYGVLFNAVGHIIDFRGKTPKKIGMEWGGGEILALSANNVKMGKIDPSLEAYHGSEALYEKWMTSGDTEKGDVLMTMEAPLGNVAQVPDNQKYILSQRVALFRACIETAKNDWLAYLMSNDNFQKKMSMRATGTTAAGIQRKELMKIKIPIPPVREQEKAAKILQEADRAIDKEKSALKKLQKQKKGLMDDLLTGRVRVTPLLKQEVSATTD